MKGDTPLDYAEFQLTQSRTRCELFVCSEGMTEKLASGFFKPFVTHLRAVEVQVARGNQVIRLEAHPSDKAHNKWFTKGTVERFVRFVSTPEVIERVKTIENELAQLEQVRSALAKTFAQTEGRFPSIDAMPSSNGAYQESDATSMMQRKYSMDADDIGAEASKRELLRAMDVRLIALKQEQDLAFSRAAAAGFDTNKMADLMTFAEHFGAHRLGDACVQFITAFRKRNVSNGGHEDIDSPSAEAASSGSDMSLASTNEIDLAAESDTSSRTKSRNSEAWLDGQKRRADSNVSENTEDRAFTMRSHEKAIDNSNVRTRSNMDTRRRWGPPEKLQMDYPSPQVHHSHDTLRTGNAAEINKDIIHLNHQVDENLRGSAVQVGQGFPQTMELEEQSNFSQKVSTVSPHSDQKLSPGESPHQGYESVSKGGRFFARLQQMAQQVEARRSDEALGGSIHSISIGMCDQSQPHPQETPMNTSSMWLEPGSMLQDPGDQGHVQSQVHEVKSVPLSSPSSQLVQRSTMRNVRHLGSVALQDVNHPLPQNEVSAEKSTVKKCEEVDAMEGEGSKAKDTPEDPVSAPVRRLSVKDAVSLFEGKKKNSDEPALKKLVRQESRRGPMEGGNSPTSEKVVLRRWSGTNFPNSGESPTQEQRTVLENIEAKQSLQPEFSKNKDGASKESTTDTNLTNCNQSRPVDEEPVTKIRKSSMTTVPHGIQLQHSEQSSLSTCSEADTPSVKNCSSLEQHCLGSDAVYGHDEDLQKHFRRELAKCLTREARNADAVDAVISPKSEVDSAKVVSVGTKKHPMSSYTEPKNEGQSIMNSTTSDAKGRAEQEEKGSRLVQNTKHILPTSALSGSTMAGLATRDNNNTEQRASKYVKQGPPVKESEIIGFKDMVGSQTIGETRVGKFQGQQEQHLTREPSVSVQNTPVDLHMQALVKMVNNQYHDSVSVSGEDSASRHRGRFYEHYMRLRDARLRGEHPAKRAEREAKLKSMQETLERRKAEIEARSIRPLKKNSRLAKVQLGVEKPQDKKSGLFVAQMEQEVNGDEEGTDQEDCSLQMQDQFYEYGNLTSPASISRSSKNQASALKPSSAKKTVQALPKSSTMPRTSVRTATSSSPRSAPKNPTAPPSQRKLTAPNQNGVADGSISKSCSNLPDPRKEMNKTSSGRMLTSARLHSKSNGHSQIVADASTLADSNGNIVDNDDSLPNTGDKLDMKHQSRKSFTSTSDVKSLFSGTLDAGIMEPLRGQQEGDADLNVYGKVKQNDVTLTQEARPFQQKGQGISPEFVSGGIKQRTSVSLMDTSHNTDEDLTTDPLVHVEAVDPTDRNCEAQNIEGITKTNLIDDSEDNVKSQVPVISNIPVMYTSKADEDQPSNMELEALDPLLEDASSNGTACHTPSFLDDLHDGSRDLVSIAQGSFLENSKYKQKAGGLSVPLSQLLSQKNTESLVNNGSFVTSSASFRAASLPHEHITSSFTLASASPANSSRLQSGTISGRFAPSPAMALDSPLGSPASWNFSQIPSETDVSRSRRHLSGPQKPSSNMSLPPKEPAKGFKRLLHFGRKTRASETAAADCVSASTASEGDDEWDEARDLGSQSSDDPFRRTRMQERSFEAGQSGDHFSCQDQGASQFLRSSIPAPPANFKLREDHLSGGTLMKAPRSFFSLSTFRSRGSEAKSR